MYPICVSSIKALRVHKRSVIVEVTDVTLVSKDTYEEDEDEKDDEHEHEHKNIIFQKSQSACLTI